MSREENHASISMPEPIATPPFKSAIAPLVEGMAERVCSRGRPSSEGLLSCMVF